MISFRDGTPYQGEDLFFDPAAQPGFVARCSRPGAAGTPGMCLLERRIESADVTVRFPSEWLTGWRAVNEGIEKLMAKMKPGRLLERGITPSPCAARPPTPGAGDLAGRRQRTCVDFAANCAGRLRRAPRTMRAAACDCRARIARSARSAA